MIRQGLLEPSQACTHWLKEGINEGRQAHPGFDAKDYLERNPQLAKAKGVSNYSAALTDFLTKKSPEKRASFSNPAQPTTSTAPLASTPITRRTLMTMLEGSPLFVSASTRTAGAIDSLVWANTEFINAFDHGRELQIAFAKGSAGECYNPTEAGSQLDAQDLDKVKQSSSTLLSWSQTANQLFTETVPAFWMRPGQRKPRSCGQAQNDSITASQTRIHKTVTLGYGKLSNVIAMQTSVELLSAQERYEPKAGDNWSAAFEVPTGYLAPEFNSFYTFNPKTQVLRSENARAKACLEPSAKISCEQGLPLIVSKDANTAMGICAVNAAKGFREVAYGVFDIPSQRSSLANTSKWNVVQRSLGVVQGPTRFTFTTFLAIGNMQSVQASMTALHQNGECAISTNQ